MAGSQSKLFAAGAFLAITTAASVYLHRLHTKSQKTNTKNNNNKTTDTSRPSSAARDPTVPPQILEMFEVAATESKELQNISNMEKLILYSLYKQSNDGDAPEQFQGLSINVVERAKFSAWEQMRGMSTTSAMIHYIEAVNQLKTKGKLDENQGGGGDFDAGLDSGGLGPTQSTLANSVEDEGDGYPEGKDLTTAQKLLRASASNNVEEIRSILQQEGNDDAADSSSLVNHRDEDGQSALHLSADKGAVDAMKLLVEAGANVNAADGDGITVLQAAVIAENIEACRILLEHGADPDKADCDGDTPRACAEDAEEEIKNLFDSL